MGKKVIFCNCGGKLADGQYLEEFSSILQHTDIQLVTIFDLCGVSVTKKDVLQTLFSTHDEFLVIACYARAVKLLLRNIGIDAESGEYTFLNFKEHKSEALFEKIKSFYKEDYPSKSLTKIESDPDWPSWFPLIDESRCSACGQCADFCLFGVYEKQEGKIKVVNPKGCKNNCPACARLCPNAAIIFPKYSEGGAIGGSDLVNEIVEQQRQRIDMDSMLGIDIYKTLEQQKSKRQSIIKSEAMSKALEEREKALNAKADK